jgi:ankyrin repeat protein
MINNYNKLVKKQCLSSNINDIYAQIGGSKKNKKRKQEINNNRDIIKEEEIDENELIELLNKENWKEIILKYKNPRNVKVNGNNLLHLACARGEINAINYYLLKYPELFYVSNSEGDTCAHILTKYGHFEILKKLLPKYPEVIQFINKKGDNLLDLTIKEPEIMGWLLNLMPREYFEEMDQSKVQSLKSLIELIKLNKGKDIYLYLIQKLISMGYNLNMVSPYNPLIIASKLNRPHIVSTLLENGANPNVKDNQEKTSLIYATENKSYESMELLLKEGSNINYAGPEGDNFPLNIALENHDNKSVSILLKYKDLMDFSFKNRNLEIPLHIAIKNNIENNFLNPTNFYKIIYESDLNSKNLKNTTPLHLLARYSHNENLHNYSSVLEKKELDLNIKDSNNKTPYNYLSREGKNLISKIKEGSLKKSTKNKESGKKLNMPNIKNNNFTLFNSDILHNAIYTHMILKKYKNLAIPKTNKSHEIQMKEYDNFSYLANYKSGEGKLIKDIISIYYESFNDILPHLILWNSRDLYYINDELEDSVKILLEDKSVDFIMIKLSLIPNNTGTHANIIIYNKKLNSLERFEPYGPNEMLDENELNKFLELKLCKIFGKKSKFIHPRLFMEETKFQIVSSDSDPEIKKTGDPLGFCMAWCFWYFELRIKNPELESKNLVEYAFKNILNFSNKEKHDSNVVLNYIRNYSIELDKMKNKFLKECGISEKNYYNLNFNDNQIQVILDKLKK